MNRLRRILFWGFPGCVSIVAMPTGSAEQDYVVVAIDLRQLKTLKRR